MIVPILLVGGGVLALVALAAASWDGPVPKHDPDLPPMPGSTRYKRVDALLPELKRASDSSGVPLGLLVGWIARESGGRIDEVPKPLKGEPDGERGYFQLTPSESAALGLDHARLSTDPTYSINAGLALIGKYMKAVDALGVAAQGSTYYWMLVKLAHTMGVGALNKIVAAAKGDARTWSALEKYALEHDSELTSLVKHSPKKWFPLVDAVYDVGAPFGFGTSGATAIVGAVAFDDIPDPLDCLPRS